ncbi:hypothetical protein RvY_10231 [Ramazzottius varieornatus]|uniref:RING-type domain-containing protein n=1 Tax=Ramazzottius varieornatus TaxID=947166 RepID=A0A1D1VC37_RAMVA|nr:hypothetical protein RvY_10231 [Ramazzottius varieornatus]
MSQWDQLRTVELRQLSAKFACPLCRGYMIDCVVAEECGHSYCRSCIARHIAGGLVTCPACHKLINQEEPGEPFDKLRADPILQRMIYKLVPSLLARETMQRAEYSGSEKDARKDIKRTVGDKVLFFNERSNVGVELKPVIEQSSSSTTYKDAASDKRFIRLELGTPLSVVIDFIKFRFAAGLNKPGIRLYQSATRSDQPLPAESFRLIELAYLTKWDMMRPLPVYYEIINNRPADSLQPLKLMPASSKPESHLDRAASTLRHGQPAKEISEKTASSVLWAAGKPAEQGMPPTPSTSSSSASDMKRCASSKTPTTSGSNLKLKFNKNIGGRWRLTSSSSSSSPDHDSNDVYSFPAYQPSHDNTTSKPSASKPSSSKVCEKYSVGHSPKRPLYTDDEYCSETSRSSKVAKVLPVTTPPADKQPFPGPSKIDRVLARRDSAATSLLFHTGLVPVDQHSLSRTNIGANNFSMQRILQQY